MKEKNAKTNRGQLGFTLIELLIVITILGVLAGVAIPRLVQFLNKGQDEAAITECNNVQKAMLAYMVTESIITVISQETPVQLVAGGPGLGGFLTYDTGWTYTWDEVGIVAQGDRVE